MFEFRINEFLYKDKKYYSIISPGLSKNITLFIVNAYILMDITDLNNKLINEFNGSKLDGLYIVCFDNIEDIMKALEWVNSLVFMYNIAGQTEVLKDVYGNDILAKFI